MTNELYLQELIKRPKISPGKAQSMIEACFWCLQECQHPNGVKLKVVQTDDTSQDYFIYWPNELDKEAIAHSFNQADAVEEGAEAIAFLLVMVCTQFTAIRRAVTGTGIDYWLGFEDCAPNRLFHQAARLEVSGILHETPQNSVASRLKQKVKQTQPTDQTLPVYVVIVEFSQPWSKMVLKNVKH